MKTRTIAVFALLCAMAVGLMDTSRAHAATITQLDITGGSVNLNFGSLGSIIGNYNTNGQLIMNQFQPLPNIFNPVTISHLTLSIFTSKGGGLKLPVPTGETSGATLTANLQSLFAGFTSTGWSWVNTDPKMASLNIGGNAAGSFNALTNAFDISWTRSFSGVPYLTSGTFTLQGTAQVAVVPLPGALFLFGSGVLGLAGAMRKKIVLS